MGVPVIRGGDGIEKIIESDLADEENAALQKSVENVKSNVGKLPL